MDGLRKNHKNGRAGFSTEMSTKYVFGEAASLT